MSLSQKNLSSIQKAGQGVHDALESTVAAVRTQAESMVTSMSNAPFSVESEQMISRFKTLSKLSQGLAAVEAQLQELYAMAADLAGPAPDVIVLPSISKRRGGTNAAAVGGTSKPSAPTKAEKKDRKDKKGALKAVSLTSNDNKLLTYLQGALSGGDAKAITGNAMSVGSGLPLGSLGVSLKKVKATGAVEQVGRGTYQLSATASALSAEPVAKSATAKRGKPASVVKKVKAAQAEVLAKKAVKAAPAKRAKASVAKKAKSVAGTSISAVEVITPVVDAEAAPL